MDRRDSLRFCESGTKILLLMLIDRTIEMKERSQMVHLKLEMVGPKRESNVLLDKYGLCSSENCYHVVTMKILNGANLWVS